MLKERIGRKVGYNKSWIRPGYQVKHSPSKQRNQIPAAGYESDQSSHEGDSGHRDRHLGFRNSARKTSLLERMGINPDINSGDDEDEDTEAVAKSLIERVGLVAGVEPIYGTFSKASPDNIDPSKQGQESVKVLAKTLTSEALGALPLTTDSENTGLATTNVPGDGNKDDHPLSPNARNIFKDHTHDGERFNDDEGFSGPSKQGNAENSTPPRSLCTPTEPLRPGSRKSSDSYSNDIDMLSAHSSCNATPLQTSSIEDGEVRDLETPEKVRELLAPLMLQNAASRTTVAHDAGPLDMDTLTDKVCSSFQGRVKDLRKSMDLGSIENRTNIPAAEAHHGLIKSGSANDSPQQQTGNTQKEVAIQPKASTSQLPTRREESSHPTLRYTPSPQRHHQSHSSVGANPSLQANYLREDRRSSSPLHHTSRRSSPSGERKHRLPPNAREYHSPPPSLRESRRSPSPSRQRRYRVPPNAHEYHSPEPHFPREGRRSLSPSPHVGRRGSLSGEYRHRLPSSAHEYHSPEPPSPRRRSPRRQRSPVSASRSRFFPDKFRRSPDNRSKSPSESGRPRRGAFNRHERIRGAYRGQGRRNDYPTRRSASPRPRRPYKPYSTNRRGSRSPQRHSQSPDSPRISDRSRYLTDRQHEPKTVPDDSLSSRSMSISEPSSGNNRNGLSENNKLTGPAVKPSLDAEQLAPGKTTTAAEYDPDILPCHHVPGLWFVKVAHEDMGTLECSFDIDSETALKWNFSRIGCVFYEICLQSKFQDIISSDNIKSDVTDCTLSLQICCFSTELVEETFRSLQHTTPEDVASAIFSLKTEWPPQGHLVIAVNPQLEEDHAKRVFLPEKLGPTNSPIYINDLVHQGQNIVQFIQLANMAGKVFALCASKKEVVKPPVTYASKEENTDVGTHSSVVKVLLVYYVRFC